MQFAHADLLVQVWHLGPVGDRRKASSPSASTNVRSPTSWMKNQRCLTETTVHVTYRPVSEADLEGGLVSPIGGTIPDLSWHILDRDLNPVPRGAVGELYIGRAGLARGYRGGPG